MTDDLFVKMNARGKWLSRYDTFKSDLESALEKKQKNDAETETVDKWKQEIDNSILDGYFERFGAKYAERNLFRTILFYCKALTAMQKKAYDDSWEKDEKDAKSAGAAETINREAAREIARQLLLRNLSVSNAIASKACIIY